VLPMSAHDQVAILKKGQKICVSGLPDFKYRGADLNGSVHFTIGGKYDV